MWLDALLLYEASFQGHEKDVRLLLKQGAKINARLGPYGNALQAASFQGHEEVVKLLLSKGAKVNAQCGHYGNALQAASFRGHQEVVKLLLRKGAEVNAQGGHYGNALQAALSGNALQAELSEGHERVVELLLEQGAVINAQGWQATLSHKAHEEAAPLPPGQGAVASAQGEQHEDTLQAASHKDDRRFELQGATESRPMSTKSSDAPIPSETEDGGSESGYEIMSEEDEDLDSMSPEHTSPLASLRDRISDPVEYFDRLEILAHLTYRHSTLQTYNKSHWPRTVAEKERYFEPCPGYPQSPELMLEKFEPLPDSHVVRICQDMGVIHNAFANDLLEILECRNVNAQTYLNLKRLQLDGFCMQKFSMLTIDPCRHDVARLLPVDIQQVLQLLKEIELVLKKVANFAWRTQPATSSAEVFLEQALGEQDNLLLSVPCCTEFLTTLGLALTSPADPSFNLSIPAVMRLVVHTVDLAVASYAGAHLSRFDEEYLGEKIDALDVLSPFSSRHSSQVSSIKLSRCQLQCLDSFHNSKPLWVFSWSEWKPRDRLFLSTKIEDFADIWGPLWKVIDPETKSCTRYVVGNGSIYKYKSEEATPRLLENESLCHWISNTRSEADSELSPNTEKPIFPNITEGSFDGNENLLIGAVAAGCERLATKRDCNFDLENCRSALDHVGRVQMLGTVKEHTYKDSDTYQLQAGHSGMSISASKQYKRRGQSLKQAFVELWTTTPELRDPRLLEDFYGVEISLCTRNAQKVQLGRILGLDSMCQYLRSFRWKTDLAKQAYFDALKGFRDDSDALQHAWERHNQYQEDFGRAVLICLKALERTGINHKGQLSTFLCSEVTARPELVAIEPKEHSWIGLLKDSENSCCMAAIGDECLEFRHEFGSICGQSRRSCLRTALVINQLSKPNGICKKRPTHEATDGWTSRWSVSAMESNSDVWLGRHGTLRLLSRLPDSTLLMDWRASPITTAVKSFIDREKPHREYSENIRKEARRTRPIPLFVMSN